MTMLKLSPTKQITLGAMCIALTVLSLYAAAVLPTMRIACWFISSVFVYILCAEQAYFSALLVYAASTALAFLILPSRMALIPYAFLLGHYGIFKTFLDERLGDRFVGSLLKLLYCNLFFALAVLLAVFVMKYDLSALTLPVPLWAVVPLLQIAFLLYDFLYFTCQKFYLAHIRNAVIPRR